MELEAILAHNDPTAHRLASPECQQLLAIYLVLAIYLAYYQQHGFTPLWTGYYIVREGVVVGSCSFIGSPTANTVELAYWTFPAFERQGVASFACRALLALARTADPTVRIAAKTAPAHNASTHILHQNGFAFSGIVQDDDIGDAWLWTLDEARRRGVELPQNQCSQAPLVR